MLAGWIMSGCGTEPNPNLTAGADASETESNDSRADAGASSSDGEGDTIDDGDGDTPGEPESSSTGDTCEVDPESCPQEIACEGKKPNVLFVLDYSTSMNQIWENDQTRWELTTAVLGRLTQPGSKLSHNAHVALIRFGHDPDPDNWGTEIPGDGSGLRDGSVLDVPWYDADAKDAPWYECNGGAITSALVGAGPPMMGNLDGIEAWVKGAMVRAKGVVSMSKDVHPEDEWQRPHFIVLLIDGVWTNEDGKKPLAPVEQDPKFMAAYLWENLDTRTHVVTIGDEPAETVADEIANAGGTGQALDGDTPQLLEQALLDIIDENVVDICCTMGY